MKRAEPLGRMVSLEACTGRCGSIDPAWDSASGRMSKRHSRSAAAGLPITMLLLVLSMLRVDRFSRAVTPREHQQLHGMACCRSPFRKQSKQSRNGRVDLPAPCTATWERPLMFAMPLRRCRAIRQRASRAEVAKGGTVYLKEMQVPESRHKQLAHALRSTPG